MDDYRDKLSELQLQLFPHSKFLPGLLLNIKRSFVFSLGHNIYDTVKQMAVLYSKSRECMC